MLKNLELRRIISIGILFAFLSNGWTLPSNAQELYLPAPGTMVPLSSEFTPAYLKGVVIHPQDPFKFDFIIYRGDKLLTDAQKRAEYIKLTKYFLASLAIPDDDQWVNLSPYEKDRIIKDDFGKTVMGRDLLAQDYLLKEITASLIYPESKLGKEFWKKVYAQAQKKYGTTNIPVNTFNKVWILPDDALIYEKGDTAYVLKNHLRVMLEEDYLSLQKHSGIISGVIKRTANDTHTIASKIVKEIVLPELQREVNEDANFAPLRQVYSGMLLATWFKRTLKESLLGQIYANKAKIKGVDQDPRANEAIYQRYLQAYKKGVFNFIKEDADGLAGQTFPRKYFSGGTLGYARTLVNITHDAAMGSQAMIKDESKDDMAQVALVKDAATADHAQISAHHLILLLFTCLAAIAALYLPKNKYKKPAPVLPKPVLFKKKGGEREILRQLDNSKSLYETARIIASFHDNIPALSSAILHSKEMWSVFLALGTMQNETRQEFLDQFNGKPINGDSQFIQKYNKLNRDLDKILQDLDFNEADHWKEHWDKLLDESVDTRLDYTAEKFVVILNECLLPQNQHLLPLLKEEILPQFEVLNHPLTRVLKDLDDWLAYSIMGYHEEYVDRTNHLSKLTQWPWASATIFAANGPHTRFTFTKTDWDDIKAQTYLINGFIGIFLNKFEQLARMKNKGSKAARELEYEVKGYAGALLNGLLVQSDWTEEHYMKKLSKSAVDGISLGEAVRKALSLYPAGMPSFLHAVDGNFANEVLDDLAFFDSVHGTKITSREIFFGLPSQEADWYRQRLEEATRKHPDADLRLEKISTVRKKYAWLRAHYGLDAAKAAGKDNAMTVDEARGIALAALLKTRIPDAAFFAQEIQSARTIQRILNVLDELMERYPHRSEDLNSWKKRIEVINEVTISWGGSKLSISMKIRRSVRERDALEVHFIAVNGHEARILDSSGRTMDGLFIRPGEKKALEAGWIDGGFYTVLLEGREFRLGGYGRTRTKFFVESRLIPGMLRISRTLTNRDQKLVIETASTASATDISDGIHDMKTLVPGSSETVEFSPDAAMAGKQNPPVVDQALDKLDEIIQRELAKVEDRTRVQNIIGTLKQEYSSFPAPELKRQFEELENGLVAIIGPKSRRTSQHALVVFILMALEDAINARDFLKDKPEYVVPWDEIYEKDTLPDFITYVYERRQPGHLGRYLEFALPLLSSSQRPAIASALDPKDDTFAQELYFAAWIGERIHQLRTYDRAYLGKNNRLTEPEIHSFYDEIFFIAWTIAEQYGLVSPSIDNAMAGGKDKAVTLQEGETIVEIASAGGAKFLRRWVKGKPKARVLVIEPIDRRAIDELWERKDIDYDVLRPDSEISERTNGYVPFSKQQLIAVLKKAQADDPDGRGYEYIVPFVNLPIDKEVMDAAPGLKGITSFGTGYNNIDFREARARGIVVTNAPGPLTIAMAEFTTGLALEAKYRIPEAVYEAADTNDPRTLANIHRGLEGNGYDREALVQLIWGQLLRLSLKYDEMFKLVNEKRFCKCGVGPNATVLHDQLGQDLELGINTSLGIIAGKDRYVLDRLINLATAFEIGQINVYADESLDEKARADLMKGNPHIKFVSSQEALGSDYVIVAPDATISKASGAGKTAVDARYLGLRPEFDNVLKQSLWGQTFAIAGLGRIGKATAKRVIALGMKVVFTSSEDSTTDYGPTIKELAGQYNELRRQYGKPQEADPVQKVDTPELFRRANVLAPLMNFSEAARNYINRERLDLIQDSHVIILNTARGPVVNEADLMQFMNDHPQAQARLDVLVNETEKTFEGLNELPNVKVTGHTGSAVPLVRLAMEKIPIMDNLLRLIDGSKPGNLIPELKSIWEAAAHIVMVHVSVGRPKSTQGLAELVNNFPGHRVALNSLGFPLFDPGRYEKLEPITSWSGEFTPHFTGPTVFVGGDFMDCLGRAVAGFTDAVFKSGEGEARVYLVAPYVVWGNDNKDSLETVLRDIEAGQGAKYMNRFEGGNEQNYLKTLFGDQIAKPPFDGPFFLTPAYRDSTVVTVEVGGHEEIVHGQKGAQHKLTVEILMAGDLRLKKDPLRRTDAAMNAGKKDAAMRYRGNPTRFRFVRTNPQKITLAPGESKDIPFSGSLAKPDIKELKMAGENDDDDPILISSHGKFLYEGTTFDRFQAQKVNGISLTPEGRDLKLKNESFDPVEITINSVETRLKANAAMISISNEQEAIRTFEHKLLGQFGNFSNAERTLSQIRIAVQNTPAAYDRRREIAIYVSANWLERYKERLMRNLGRYLLERINLKLGGKRNFDWVVWRNGAIYIIHPFKIKTSAIRQFLINDLFVVEKEKERNGVLREAGYIGQDSPYLPGSSARTYRELSNEYVSYMLKSGDAIDGRDRLIFDLASKLNAHAAPGGTAKSLSVLNGVDLTGLSAREMFIYMIKHGAFPDHVFENILDESNEDDLSIDRAMKVEKGKDGATDADQAMAEQEIDKAKRVLDRNVSLVPIAPQKTRFSINFRALFGKAWDAMEVRVKRILDNEHVQSYIGRNGTLNIMVDASVDKIQAAMNTVEGNTKKRLVKAVLFAGVGWGLNKIGWTRSFGDLFYIFSLGQVLFIFAKEKQEWPSHITSSLIWYYFIYSSYPPNGKVSLFFSIIMFYLGTKEFLKVFSRSPPAENGSDDKQPAPQKAQTVKKDESPLAESRIAQAIEYLKRAPVSLRQVREIILEVKGLNINPQTGEKLKKLSHDYLISALDFVMAEYLNERRPKFIPSWEIIEDAFNLDHDPSVQRLLVLVVQQYEFLRKSKNKRLGREAEIDRLTDYWMNRLDTAIRQTQSGKIDEVLKTNDVILKSDLFKLIDRKVQLKYLDFRRSYWRFWIVRFIEALNGRVTENLLEQALDTIEKAKNVNLDPETRLQLEALIVAYEAAKKSNEAGQESQTVPPAAAEKNEPGVNWPQRIAAAREWLLKGELEEARRNIAVIRKGRLSFGERFQLNGLVQEYFEAKIKDVSRRLENTPRRYPVIVKIFKELQNLEEGGALNRSNTRRLRELEREYLRVRQNDSKETQTTAVDISHVRVSNWTRYFTGYLRDGELNAAAQILDFVGRKRSTLDVANQRALQAAARQLDLQKRKARLVDWELNFNIALNQGDIPKAQEILAVVKAFIDDFSSGYYLGPGFDIKNAFTRISKVLSKQKGSKRKDHLKVLGLASNATSADIKRAWKEIAKKNHPDANPGNPEAAKRYTEASAAHDALKDNAQIADPFGGIDLNSANLNLRIKRDGNGVPLPLAQQDLAQLSNIQGLDPVILSIKPASQTTLFSELLR